MTQAPKPTRLRRPEPERTTPNRGILGIFGQSGWTQGGPQPSEPPVEDHPLGIGCAPGTGADKPSSRSQGDANILMDKEVREASDLVDRHIRDGLLEDAGPDDSLLGRMASLYGSTQANDLTALATQLTRTYAELATQWVHLAGNLRDQLGLLKGVMPKADIGGSGVAGPTLVIRAATEVEARIDMFRAAGPLTAQPLMAEDPALKAQITKVAIENGQLRIAIPADQPIGTYHGLLIETGSGPAGTVTVKVLGPEE